MRKCPIRVFSIPNFSTSPTSTPFPGANHDFNILLSNSTINYISIRLLNYDMQNPPNRNILFPCGTGSYEAKRYR